MTKLLIAISFLFLVGIPFANAEQVYYCSDLIGTGLQKDKKTSEWESLNWKLYRHTIKFNKDFTKLDGLHEGVSFKCEVAMNGLVEDAKSIMICNSSFLNIGSSFIFDRNSLRYLYFVGIYTGWVENSGDADSNSISGGTCKKF